MLAMLVHGTSELPEKVPVLSPWVDADLGVPADAVATTLTAQIGRRVVKTHTPADGFPVWDGVTVVAVYRHRPDIFFSLRNHEANKRVGTQDHPMALPVSESVRLFIDDEKDTEDCDTDTLASVVHHYTETVLSGRIPNLFALHYSDMLADGYSTVQSLANAIGVQASDALVEEVAEATAFSSMKSNAANYAPVAGTGYWKSDAGFFASGGSGKWEDRLSKEELDHFDARLMALLPDTKARDWLKAGKGSALEYF